MQKHIIKESQGLTDNTKDKVNCGTSKGGICMDKDMNIIEKGKLAKKAEDIKVSLDNGMYQAKKILLKGISLGTALSIIMSSVAFGGEHYVNNWEDYKRAIVEDIMKQDREIIIYYEGDEKFSSSEDINNQIKNLYLDARSNIKGTVEDKNVTEVGWKYNYVEKDKKYDFKKVAHEMTYKNSAEDFEEVQRIIDAFISENITDNMSDYEKVRTVYDFVIGRLNYGYTGDVLAERNMLLGLQGEPVVCEAYAMLFAKMITELGYNNMIISGKAGNPPEGHAWNLVEIDGQWYHVDPTWGDDEDVKEQDKYFLTSDEIIENKNSQRNSRTWDKGYYPEAPSVYEDEGQDEGQVQGLRDKVLRIEEQVQGFEGQVQGLRVEDVNSIEDIKRLRDEVQGLREQIQGLGEEVQIIEVEVQDLDEGGYDVGDLYLSLGDLSTSLATLENDLNSISILLDEKEAELESINEQIKKAILAVEKAETTKTQEDIDLARALVNELPSEDFKNELISRLDNIEIIVEEPEDEEPEDEEPVEEELEDEEPEGEEPEDEEPEGEQVQGLRDKVLRIEEQVQGFEGQVQGLRVEDVNSIEDIKRLRGDVQGLREQIQGLREKVQIIEVEIQDLAKGGYDLGDLYLSLGDLSTSLATLENDLNSISILLDEKEAELELTNERIEKAILAVEKAETTKTQKDMNLAIDLVNELPDGEIKDKLINRLEAIEVIVEEPEEDLDEEEEKEAEEESPEDNDEDDENKEPIEDETDEEDETREDNSDENKDEKSEVEPEDEEPKEEERPSRPIINRPERPIVREDKKKEDKPVVKNETRDDVKSEEEIRKENLKISKEKINELNAILRIIPNMNVTITVKNTEIKPDVKPYIYKEKEEKILVPIRFVAEALGFEVNWSKATWDKGIKKVFLSCEGKGIVMEIGKDMAYVNGKPVKMDIAPELKDSRTYISLDFIVEILETNFNYNNISNDIFFNIF